MEAGCGIVYSNYTVVYRLGDRNSVRQGRVCSRAHRQEMRVVCGSIQ
jgi:hypothetical protein